MLLRQQFFFAGFVKMTFPILETMHVTAAIHSHKNRSSIHKEKEKEAIAKIGETMGDGIMCDGHISKKMKINNQFDDYEVRPDIEDNIMDEDMNGLYWAASDGIIERFGRFNDKSVIECHRSSMYGRLSALEVGHSVILDIQQKLSKSFENVLNGISPYAFSKVHGIEVDWRSALNITIDHVVSSEAVQFGNRRLLTLAKAIERREGGVANIPKSMHRNSS